MNILKYKDFKQSRLILESLESNWIIDDKLKDILSDNDISEINELWGELVVGADVGIRDYNSKLRNCVARLYIGEQRKDASTILPKIIRYIIEYDKHLKDVDDDGVDNKIDTIRNIKQLQKLLTPLSIEISTLKEYEEKKECDILWSNFEWVIYVPYTYDCAKEYGNDNWHHVKRNTNTIKGGNLIILYNRLVPKKYSFYIEMDYKNICELCDRFDTTIIKDVHFKPCTEAFNDNGFADLGRILRKLWNNDIIQLPPPPIDDAKEIFERDLRETFYESDEGKSGVASRNPDLFLKHIDIKKFFTDYSEDMVEEFKRKLDFHIDYQKENKIKKIFIDYLAANIPIEDFKEYLNIKEVQNVNKSRVQNYAELSKDISVADIFHFLEITEPSDKITDIIKKTVDVDDLDDLEISDLKEFVVKIWGEEWYNNMDLMKDIDDYFNFESWIDEYIDTLKDEDIYQDIQWQLEQYEELGSY